MPSFDDMKFWENNKTSYIPDCGCPDCTKMRRECFDLCYADMNQLKWKLDTAYADIGKRNDEIERLKKLIPTADSRFMYTTATYSPFKDYTQTGYKQELDNLRDINESLRNTNMPLGKDLDNARVNYNKLQQSYADLEKKLNDEQLKHVGTKLSLDLRTDAYNKLKDRTLGIINSLQSVVNILDKIGGYSLVTGSIEWCINQLKNPNAV